MFHKKANMSFQNTEHALKQADFIDLSLAFSKNPIRTVDLQRLYMFFNDVFQFTCYFMRQENEGSSFLLQLVHPTVLQ